jgi:hypothetical protein
MSTSSRVSDAVLSPHCAIIGNVYEKSQMFVYVDGKPVVLADDAIDAFNLVYQMYFCLWLHFPKAVQGCYKVLQGPIF